MTHEEIQEALPELLSARLPPEPRRLLEEHLAGCADCREFAADIDLLKREVREGGEEMFEPHPAFAALRRLADRGTPDDDPRVRRHLDLCVVCQLRLRSLERLSGVQRAVPRIGRPAAWIRWMSLATAAGAVIGFFAGRLLLPHGPLRVGDSRPPAAVSTPTTEIAWPERSPILRVLPRLLRDGRIPTQPWVLDPADPYVSVGVPLILPLTAAESDRFRFELRKKNGEVVWTQEMAVTRIRQHLEAGGVVSLAWIPKGQLEAGDYELRVTPADVPDAAPIYQSDVQITYLQSPAATNAPQ